MNETSDVIVVGGGPCGSFTALKLAKLGRSVTVFEEHNQIGVPSHCAGHLSMKGLKQLGLHPLPPEIVENTFYGANFYSPKGNEFSVHLSQPVTCAVDRAMFDKYICRKSQRCRCKLPPELPGRSIDHKKRLCRRNSRQTRRDS